MTDFLRAPDTWTNLLIRLIVTMLATVMPCSGALRTGKASPGAHRLAQDGEGSHFDPELVGPFATMLRQARVQRLAFDHPVVEVGGVEVGDAN